MWVIPVRHGLLVFEKYNDPTVYVTFPRTFSSASDRVSFFPRFYVHLSFLEDSSVNDNLIPSFLFEERKKISSSYLTVTEMKDSAKHLSPS